MKLTRRQCVKTPNLFVAEIAKDVRGTNKMMFLRGEID